MITQARLRPHYLRNNHLKEPERVNEPLCTWGQTIRYLDDQGQWVVEVSRYFRTGGRIGGSGQPDPKRLRIGNLILIADTQFPAELR